MVGKSKDPKDARITIRLSERIVTILRSEAGRHQVTVGELVRRFIHDRLSTRSELEDPR